MFSGVKYSLRYSPNKFGENHIYAGIFVAHQYQKENRAIIAFIRSQIQYFCLTC